MALSSYLGDMANVSLKNSVKLTLYNILCLEKDVMSSNFLYIHRVNELQDPTYQYKVDIANFQVSGTHLPSVRSFLWKIQKHMSSV